MYVGPNDDGPAMDSDEISLGGERASEAFERFGRIIEVSAPRPDGDDPLALCARERNIKSVFVRGFDRERISCDLKRSRWRDQVSCSDESVWMCHVWWSGS